MLSLIGYKIEKIDLTNLIIPSEISEIIKGKTMLSKKAQINIIELTKYIVNNSINGDFVECGVWKGGSVALMAYSLKTNNQIRNLHLFDAFDDICEPDANIDGVRAIKDVGGINFAKGELKPIKGVYDSMGGAGNYDEVLDLIKNKIMYPENYINLYKG